MVGPVYRSLRLGPERFNAVGMDLPSDVFILVVDGFVSALPSEIIAKGRALSLKRAPSRLTCSSAQGNTVSRVTSGTTVAATSPVSRQRTPFTVVVPYLHFW